MSSRLDRLLLLLDTGSTALVRSAAAKQLGDIQQSHPQELQTLLQKVYVYLKSKSWDSRVAAGEAITAIIQHVPMWGNCKGENELNAYVNFVSFSLNDIMENGTPLLGSAGIEFDSQTDQVGCQRQRLSKELGLTVGNVNLSDDLFNDEDLAQSAPPTPTLDLKQSISSMLNGTDLSAREKNKAKRKAKQLSRQNSVNQTRESVKRQKTETDEDAGEWYMPGTAEWPFITIVQLLLEDVLSPEWELRHGAAIGLRAITRRHRYSSPWLVDMSIRLVTVLALDRFGDYVSHEVVAPVRETTAQVLGILSNYMPSEDMLKLQSLFLYLLKSREWQARHGGLLAIKYLLAARQDISSEFLTALLPHIIKSISDDDDDVRAVAAAALIPVTQTLSAKVPDDLLRALSDKLWSSLPGLDDLCASTNSVITLLAELLKDNKLCEHYNSSDSSLEVLVPRLQRFMSHNIRAVRRDSLVALKVLVTIGGAWLDTVAPLFGRVLYQRIFLENEDSFHPLLAKVWKLLFEGVSEPCRRKIVADHLPLWVHLLGAPPGLALDSALFLNPPPGAALSIPMGRREYSVKCSLARALGCVAVLTDLELFTPHISSFLESGCASHKQGGCLILMDLVGRRSLPLQDSESIGGKLSELLTASLTFDELIAANQNLQIACRGLLAAAPDKPALQSLSQLPSFSVEHAFMLVHTARQLGVSSTEAGVVEAVAQSLASSSLTLSTRVYSAIAGSLVLLARLPPKLNPIIKPIMECIKKEPCEELQTLVAENLQHLIDLVEKRTPCPTYKIVKNLVTGLLEDQMVYPTIDTTINPLVFLNYGSMGSECSTPTTPATPLGTPATPTTPLTPDIMSQIATLNKWDGMITYVSYTGSINKTGRGRYKKEAEEETKEEVSRRGCGIALSHLAAAFKQHLLHKIPNFKCDVFSVLEEAEEGDDLEVKNKVTTSLYVLDHVYSSLHSSLQTRVLQNLSNITSLLLDKYTAVRHAAARLITTLATHHTVEVLNHLLSKTVHELQSSQTSHRQGVMECLHSIVKKLELTIVPYVVLLVVPMLRRMGDTAPDIRGLATLTFAQLVKLMPLDGTQSSIPGLLPDLEREKNKQKDFLEQLMDPSLIKDCQIPIKINAKLRRYQQDGVNWLWFLCQFGLHGILCDDMGLGKTLQTLCIIGTANENRTKSNPDEEPLPSLVVCPPTLIGHWVYEAEKFVDPSDISALMYHGSASERAVLQPVVLSRKHNLIICSYDVLRNDIQFFSSIRWNYCVLDEGHVIKNTKTKISQAIRSVDAQHRLILSGTPIQNNVLELWGLFDWLMPGFLGSERQFQELYSKPINASRDAKSSSKEQESGALAMEALHRQVLPFLLRRMKEDVLSDLPPKIIQDYYCTMTPLQRTLYDKFSESVDSTNLKEQPDLHVFQSLQYLRKVCNHPILVLPKSHEMYPTLESPESLNYSGKLMALNQLLLDSGIGGVSSSQVVSPHRALIFCQLKSMLSVIEQHLLRDHMPNVSYLRLDGSVPAAARIPIVNKFNSDPSYDVLLLTTSVGGLGLNLTGADTIIFVEHDWNPSKDLQAMDRAHRIGQKRVVNVYRLITKDTLEEKIMGLQKFKLNIANTVISTENASLHQMGNSGLLDLFNAGKEEETKQKKASSSKKGLSGALEELGDLWDDGEYEKEYDVKSFVESLRDAN